MENKCTKCGKVKEVNLENFKKQNSVHGFMLKCRDCCNEYNREWQLKLRSTEEGRIKDNKRSGTYRVKHKDKMSAYEKTAEYKEYRKGYRQTDKYKGFMAEYIKYERNNKPFFSCLSNIKKKLSYLLKSETFKGSIETISYLGCSKSTLIDHLNKGDNTHDDYLKGGMAVDHIIPCDYYLKQMTEKNKESLLKKMCNYKNIRICPHEENSSKRHFLDMELIKNHNIEHLL